MQHFAKSLLLSLLVATFLLPVLPQAATAQDLHESRRPSPMGMARITLDGDVYVRVVYSRPYLRGRENIFGTEESEALVPFGKLWRTGANEATEITVTGDVRFGDAVLPAGTYSLFTTPGEGSWNFHVNSKLGLNGSFGRNPETGKFEDMYSADNDAATATGQISALDEPVDQFTISFEKVDDGAHMILQWAKTEVRVPIKPVG